MAEFVVAFLNDIGFHGRDIRVHPLPGDGSKRSFWRIFPAQSADSFIAIENVPKDSASRRENIAYLRIGEHLRKKNLPIPKIHRFDRTNGWFIAEDMGERRLQEAVSLQEDRVPLYKKIIEILFRMQIEGSRGFDPGWCCQTKKYDSLVMRRYEAEYFRDSFLCNYLGMKKDWPELGSPFDYLAESASMADSRFFLHRDFQSRNIMVSEGTIGILDWQGGRLGPLPYDLASLLIDPYTGLSLNERDRIYRYYLKTLGEYQWKWVDPFKKYFPYLAIQRNLQILGAFSYLTKVRGKHYFEAYIPPALKSLHGLLDALRDPKLTPLTDLINSLLPIS